mmetsp:Transcript_148515/g.476948  ORF Transcript_148515/g.476948 Transcript_148515/m.476948 type:complete len:154 (-) Transcript_148515:54-515(-)
MLPQIGKLDDLWANFNWSEKYACVESTAEGTGKPYNLSSDFVNHELSDDVLECFTPTPSARRGRASTCSPGCNSSSESPPSMKSEPTEDVPTVTGRFARQSMTMGWMKRTSSDPESRNPVEPEQAWLCQFLRTRRRMHKPPTSQLDVLQFVVS